jgi:hypothetical protein
MATALGLKGFRIAQQAQVIMSGLSPMQGAFSDFYGDFTLAEPPGKELVEE